MPYQSKDLSALGYANGFTLWHYRTKDLLRMHVEKPSGAYVPGVLDTTGYFSPASRMVRVGDFILLNAGIESRPEHATLVVTKNAGAEVEVTLLGTCIP